MTMDRPLEGKRILVLEDDFYLATDETQILQQAGAEVLGPYGSRFDPAQLAGAGTIDAAVVDINLGGGPNFDLARTLLDRGVPFVFVTGYDSTVIPGDLSSAPRMEKPVRDSDLVTAIAKSIEGGG